MAGPWNLYAHYVGPNPSTRVNPVQRHPAVDPSAWLGPFACVIGDVEIGENVFVAPLASIRADEGSPFRIGPDCNLQDGVILHGLADRHVAVGGRSYSIYLEQRVTCAHAAVIHGPCYLGPDVFVGFNAIVFRAIVGAGAYIGAGSVVTGDVTVAAGRFVPPGATVDTQAKADRLGAVPGDLEAFAREVQRVNQEFPATYSHLFGKSRCSCGMAI